MAGNAAPGAVARQAGSAGRTTARTAPQVNLDIHNESEIESRSGGLGNALRARLEGTRKLAELLWVDF